MIDLPSILHSLKKLAIHMDCPVCGAGQTFNMTNEYHLGAGIENPLTSPKGIVTRVVYRCASCNQFQRYYFLKFDPEGQYVMKVGQFPSWEISPDRALQKMLGEHNDNYKKGLVCESQGYGIGAFSYYRRIVEETIDSLLDAITEILPSEDRERYLAVLEQAKKTTVVQNKIDLVKELLPASLRPGGVNPLSALHDALSVGLHQQSDEECMELAVAIREVLVHLVNQIEGSKLAAKQYQDGVRRILERKKQ